MGIPRRSRSMSQTEKQERAEARYFGQQSVIAVRQLIFHAGEARQWRAVDGVSGELTQMWEARATKNATDAVKYACKAAHHARLAQAAADTPTGELGR